VQLAWTPSNAARDRNSPIKAHQINLQRSLIGNEYQLICARGQPFWVCGRDTALEWRDQEGQEEAEQRNHRAADVGRFSYLINTDERIA
jgi:hypothetical protein